MVLEHMGKEERLDNQQLEAIQHMHVDDTDALQQIMTDASMDDVGGTDASYVDLSVELDASLAGVWKSVAGA